MAWEDVRRRVLGQHAALREQLAEIEALAKRFEAGDAEVGAALRERALALYGEFGAHLEDEEVALGPALRTAGGEGPRLARRLAGEHEEQRELLHYLLGRLENTKTPTVLIARELQNFVAYVRQDMEYEERVLLTAQPPFGASLV